MYALENSTINLDCSYLNLFVAIGIFGNSIEKEDLGVNTGGLTVGTLVPVLGVKAYGETTSNINLSLTTVPV